MSSGDRSPAARASDRWAYRPVPRGPARRPGGLPERLGGVAHALKTIGCRRAVAEWHRRSAGTAPSRPFDRLPERVHSPPQRDAFVDALRQRYGLGVLGAYLGGCDDGSVAP